MIFHPSRGKREVLHKEIAQAFVAWARLPACHREDVWLLALLHAPGRRAHAMARRERGGAMQIAGGSGTCLRVQQPGARLAVAEETRNLETRGVAVEPFMTMPVRIRRAQNDATRRGRGCPVEKDDKAHATLQCLGPPPGSIQRPRRGLCPRAEGLATAQDVAVALPILCAPCPTSLRVRTGGEQPAGGLAPQCGARVPSEADAFITRLRLRLVALHTMRGDARRQARSMRTPLRFGEVDPRVFRRGRRCVRSRRRLRDGERQSAPVCDIDHSERGKLHAACGTRRPAGEAVPETERLLATLRDAGRVMR